LLLATVGLILTILRANAQDLIAQCQIRNITLSAKLHMITDNENTW